MRLVVRRSSDWLRVSAAGATVLLLASVTSAELGPSMSWGEIVDAYLEDPVANGEVLIGSLDPRAGALPAPVQLVLADAHLRRGDTATARRLLAPIAEETPPTPWSSFAALGMGMVEAHRGNAAEARVRFAHAAQAPGTVGRTALLAGAYAALATGDVAAARTSLDRILREDPGAPPGVRWAAEFARANALLAEDRATDATMAFASLQSRAPGAEWAADAGYGMARALEREGDVAAARRSLEALLGDCPETASGGAAPRGTSTALGRLEPRAVLRAWLHNYRTAQLVGADSGAVFSIHGCDLAAHRLAALEDGGDPASHDVLAGEEGELARIADLGERVSPRVEGASARPSRTAAAPSGALQAPWWMIAAVGIAAVLAAGLVWRTRRGA